MPQLALPPESLQGAALIFLRMEGVAHDLRPELWEALADGNWISFHSAPQLLLCEPERRLCWCLRGALLEAERGKLSHDT